ncbi:MAG: hypothetical protein WCC12_21075 [Anaerolineales bacterium]
MKQEFLRGLSALLLVTLACRPVIAIGWSEFLFALVLFAVLLGPPLFRLIRRVEEMLRREKGDK